MIQINNTKQSADAWELELDKAIEPGWFDCIIRHLEESGIMIEHKTAKRKACYVRCARRSLYAGHLHSVWYEEDFGEPMPLHVDGKDWRQFI